MLEGHRDNKSTFQSNKNVQYLERYISVTGVCMYLPKLIELYTEDLCISNWNVLNATELCT